MENIARYLLTTLCPNEVKTLTDEDVMLQQQKEALVKQIEDKKKEYINPLQKELDEINLKMSDKKYMLCLIGMYCEIHNLYGNESHSFARIVKAESDRYVNNYENSIKLTFDVLYSIEFENTETPRYSKTPNAYYTFFVNQDIGNKLKFVSKEDYDVLVSDFNCKSVYKPDNDSCGYLITENIDGRNICHDAGFNYVELKY